MKKIIALILGICLMVLESSAQSRMKDYYILKQGIISKNKTVFKFTHNEGKDKSEYKIEQINKSKLVLKDVKTNKIMETYLQRFVPPDSTNDFNCTNQAKLQWEDFKLNILPDYIKAANKQCKSFRFCISISCDGVPQAFYLLLIPPTNINCIEYVGIKKDLAKYSFKRL